MSNDDIDWVQKGHQYEIERRIREEQDRCRVAIEQQLKDIIQNQEDLRRELDRWNQTAVVIRWAAMAMFGVVTALAGIWDWGKNYVH